MPINVKMKPGFMYFGSTINSLDLVVPFPTSGTFETSRKAQTAEAADGSVVAQMVGRSRDKLSMSWEIMDCNKWWEINNWLETNGMFFYCRYFNFNRGIWQTKRLYVENPTCVPYRPCSNQLSTNYGMPEYLRNCTLTVIDMGGEY